MIMIVSWFGNSTVSSSNGVSDDLKSATLLTCTELALQACPSSAAMLAFGFGSNGLKGKQGAEKNVTK